MNCLITSKYSITQRSLPTKPFSDCMIGFLDLSKYRIGICFPRLMNLFPFWIMDYSLNYSFAFSLAAGPNDLCILEVYKLSKVSPLLSQ